MVADTLRDALLKKVVEPAIRSSVLPPTNGFVRKVYPELMRADVMLIDPWSRDRVVAFRLPIVTTPGQSAPLPEVGDMVQVVFRGSTYQSGVIVARIDEAYEQYRKPKLEHEEKGAHVPDML